MVLLASACPVPRFLRVFVAPLAAKAAVTATGPALLLLCSAATITWGPEVQPGTILRGSSRSGVAALDASGRLLPLLGRLAGDGALAAVLLL